MNVSKFMVSTLTTAAFVGAIGLVYAQGDNKDNTKPGSMETANTGSAQPAIPSSPGTATSNSATGVSGGVTNSSPQGELVARVDRG